jgi:hypothetical protein
MFQTWFTGRILNVSGPYTWTVNDVNSSGVAIGHVLGHSGGSVLDTDFIFNGSQVVCCTEDSPFHLNDINDGGFVVGQKPSLFFSGFVGYCCGGPNDGQTPIPLTFTGAVPPFFPVYTNFQSIDDFGNTILAFQTVTDQYFNLFATPEPRSFILLATLLGGFAIVVHRRARQTTNATSKV